MSFICYHVLEHITADAQAISELYRILKPGGTCWIQTPFKEGEIYEDFSITDAAERWEHFHQEDHVRIYSAEGLAQRLSAGGFEVEILHFKEKENPDEHKQMGYKQEETILLARK
jgi:predicted SAM-dependent methyltransferase